MPPRSIEPLDRSHGRETASAEQRVLNELDGALHGALDSILITGGGEPEKLQLLESLWKRPPHGFAPIPVPCRGSTASGIAARILAITRATPVRVDAEAALARMMRTQSIRGLRPLLLLDDLEAIPLAALERLRSVADGSRVEVRWLAVGSESEASDAALALLPRPVRVVSIDSLPAPPREIPQRKSETLVPAVPPVKADPPPVIASSEPAESRSIASALPRAPVKPAPAPAPAAPPPPPMRAEAPVAPRTEKVEPTIRPVRAGGPALPRPPAIRRAAPTAAPRARAPKRERRPILSAGARRAIVGGIVACAALALLVERGPQMFAWAGEATGGSIRGATAFAVDTWTSLRGAADSFWSSAKDSGQRLAAATATTVEQALATAREYAAREPVEEPPPPVAAAPVEPIEAPTPVAPAERAAAPAERAAPPAAPAKPAVKVAKAAPAAAVAPIRVGINSDPWSNVSVDGVDLGSTPLSVALSPGRHRFRAEMADGRVVEKEIDVAKGRSEIVFR